MKNILNKLFWNKKENPSDYTITFVHRGAPGDRVTISATQIKKVGKSWFVIQRADEESIIPFHRVLAVKKASTGDVLWEKRKAKERF